MNGVFLLPDAFAFDVTGLHAERYLNARLSNDIRSLKTGNSCLAAALSAQGRVEGFFSVSRLEKEKFILLCDGGNKEEVLSALKKFVVADRVDFSSFTESFKAIHIFGELPSEFYLGKEEGLLDGPLLVTKRMRSLEKGLDIFGNTLEVDKILSAIVAADVPVLSEIERGVLRVRANIASFPEELNSKCLFAEAPFRQAVSFTKGCYVGQEVIEKIDSHGRTESMLVSYETKSSETLTPGTLISIEEESIGKVISVYKDASRDLFVGFARIKRKEGINKAKLPSGESIQLSSSSPNTSSDDK